jgi:hypothetical protein
MQSLHVAPQGLLKATCRPGAKVFTGVHSQRRPSTRIYQAGKDKQSTSLLEELTGLGDGLGPIGITVGGPVKKVCCLHVAFDHNEICKSGLQSCLQLFIVFARANLALHLYLPAHASLIMSCHAMRGAGG